MENTGVFTIEELRPIRDGLTVSRDSGLGLATKVNFFSLGKGTDISAERYDHMTLYIGAAGRGELLLGPEGTSRVLAPDTALIVPGGMLCGMAAGEGFVYTEVIPDISEEEITMNDKITPGEVFALKDMIDYEEGSIANLDVVSNSTMKYVLMAFDTGTQLMPHRAPGNAIVFALEGEATIGYEGEVYHLHAGECFRFAKDGLHSVMARGRFKMALLLVLE